MTENNNTQQLIENLAEREKVSPQKIKEIIINSFRQSYCQNENANADLHFDFTDGLLVFHRYKVVEKVNDPSREINSADNRLVQGEKKDGFFYLPLDTKNFSFSLSHEIKGQLNKNIKEVQQTRQYQLFKNLEKKIVFGKLYSFTENYCVVGLELGWGRWEKNEWLLSGQPSLGQGLYFLIREVQEKPENNSPPIILTRSNDFDNLFVRKILELEVPEIKKKSVIIQHILRLPGVVSKIVVESKESGLDPCGACVGQEASRIKSIRKHFLLERVEIAEWSENKRTLLFNLLLPSKILSIVEKEEHWEITVLRWSANLITNQESNILNLISDYIDKSIQVKVYEEIQKEKDQVIIWNTGLSPDLEKFNKKNKYEKKSKR